MAGSVTQASGRSCTQLPAAAGVMPMALARSIHTHKRTFSRLRSEWARSAKSRLIDRYKSSRVGSLPVSTKQGNYFRVHRMAPPVLLPMILLASGVQVPVIVRPSGDNMISNVPERWFDSPQNPV
jgi:hypothetical protein